MTVESMGPGRDQTRDPWTRYLLQYRARSTQNVCFDKKSFKYVVHKYVRRTRKFYGQTDEPTVGWTDLHSYKMDRLMD